MRHLEPQPRVEVGKRLVEKKHLRLHHHRAGKCYALLLTAGKLGRFSGPAKLVSPTDFRPVPTRDSSSAPERPFSRRPKATFSKTVDAGITHRTERQDRRKRLFAATRVMSAPSRLMAARLRLQQPAMERIVVVLPQPKVRERRQARLFE